MTEHPFIEFAKSLPVIILEVFALHRLPVGWSTIGDPPSDDASVVMRANLDVGVAWVRPRGKPRGEAEAMEALAHELGHVFGERKGAEILASEEAALAWEMNVIRSLDMTCPVSRAMAINLAVVVPWEDFTFGPGVEAWVAEMRAWNERELQGVHAV